MVIASPRFGPFLVQLRFLAYDKPNARPRSAEENKKMRKSERANVSFAEDGDL